MSYFFITTLQSFLPIALLLGLNWSHRSTPTIGPLSWITLLALFAGTFIGVHFPNGQAFLLGFTALQALALILFLICQCFPTCVLAICGRRFWLQVRRCIGATIPI